MPTPKRSGAIAGQLAATVKSVDDLPDKLRFAKTMTKINDEPTIPECATCNDTGYTCRECNKAGDECECEAGPTLVPCTKCGDDDDN